MSQHDNYVIFNVRTGSYHVFQKHGKKTASFYLNCQTIWRSTNQRHGESSFILPFSQKNDLYKFGGKKDKEQTSKFLVGW